MVLRWGMIGCGMISQDFANAFQTLPKQDYQILAIATRSIKTAEDFAKRFGIPKAYQGYENLAKDKEIDIVHVGLVHSKHFDVTKLLLNSGKNVLLESPFTMNKKEAEDLVKLAREKNLLLMEGSMSRYFPAYDELTKQIDSIGDILQVNVDFGFDMTYQLDKEEVKEMGGSTLLYLGIYVAQFLTRVFKHKPISIKSTGTLNQHGVDDFVAAVLKYPGNQFAIITVNGQIFLSNTAYIYGTKGTIKVPQFWCPTTLETPSKTYTYDLPPSDAKYNFPNTVAFAYQVEEAKRCLDNGLIETPKLTHKESIEMAELVETIRKGVGTIFVQDV